MKRVFIVHGWDGSPGEGWFPWLKAELEKRGFSVAVPAMPHPERPTIEDWVPALAAAVGKPDAETFFVGHSMGCQAILRYVATLAQDVKIAGAVFVAGFLAPLTNNDDLEIERPWIETPLDTEKIRRITPRVVNIFSPTDRWVPLDVNKKLFEEKLGSMCVVADGKGEKGHFAGSDGVTELAEALAAVLSIVAPAIISIDDFAKVQIKMGKILTAERVEGSDKLLKLSIDVGESAPRTICSGVAQYYQPEEVIGKMVPVITNLAPRKMRGVESNGMVMFAIDETLIAVEGAESKPGHVPVMLNPMKDVPPGSPVQ